MASLVSGIVGDVQQLIHQELQLARTEIRQEWIRARSAVGMLAAGAVLLMLAVLLFCFFFVHLIIAAGVPPWGAFAIVGGVLAILGLILAGMGYAQATRVRVIPPLTAETLKETMSWTRNPR
jgi:hypothetical protein